MASPGFTIYWSSLAEYRSCPQKFLWSRGWPGYDLGAGDGKKKPKPKLRSAHHSMMGTAIQYAIECMYNQELWRNPASLPQELIRLVELSWDMQAANPKNWVDYSQAGSREQLLDVCRNGVLGYLKTMRANKILGTVNKAELELLAKTNPHNPVGGKPDLIIDRPDTGVTIFDGKNSQKKGEYTDPDQLRWYAMVYYLVYRKMPDRLAFIYYRYPFGTPIYDQEGRPTGAVDSGLDIVEFDSNDVDRLAQWSEDVRKSTDAGLFDPTPSAQNCKWCEYEIVCPARQAQRASSGRSRPVIPEIQSSSDGYATLTLD
jgi:hypothetical protein